MSTTSFKPYPAHSPMNSRPGFRQNKGQRAFHNILRDSFTLQTWLAFGAVLQAVLFVLPIRKLYAVAPALIYLLFTLIDTIAVSTGLAKNSYMNMTHMGKWTTLIPEADGSFQRASGEGVTVFILGFTSYHPLGLLAPGVKQIGDYFMAMNEELNRDADKWGLMGSTALKAAEGASENRAGGYTIYYFKTKEDIVRYAHSDLHRQGWDWYAKNYKQYPHIGLMHELYESPAGHWETLYSNFAPTLFAATKHQVKDISGGSKYISPIVDANRGKLSSSRGRLGQANATPNDGQYVYEDA